MPFKDHEEHRVFANLEPSDECQHFEHLLHSMEPTNDYLHYLLLFLWELYEIDTKMITIIFLFTDGETEAHCLGFPKFSCSKWQK